MRKKKKKNRRRKKKTRVNDSGRRTAEIKKKNSKENTESKISTYREKKTLEKQKQ